MVHLISGISAFLRPRKRRLTQSSLRAAQHTLQLSSVTAQLLCIRSRKGQITNSFTAEGYSEGVISEVGRRGGQGHLHLKEVKYLVRAEGLLFSSKHGSCWGSSLLHKPQPWR